MDSFIDDFGIQFVLDDLIMDFIFHLDSSYVHPRCPASHMVSAHLKEKY